MTYIERIAQLEAQVAQMKHDIGQLQAASSPPADDSRGKPAALLRPLSADARAHFLIVWQMLREEHGPEGKTTYSALIERALELDDDNVMPYAPELPATLRAVLAEEAGMHLRWSTNTLRPRQSAGKKGVSMA